ncbi:DUF3310 domain-containing protein [Bremerella cremea]|uniref:DUF3310 domain-containing protein n=1 Tax=Bremerella cremea TaxID=1031537 RepID=UPI0031EBA955
MTPQHNAPELVHHPDHYNRGSMEVIDAIEGLGLGFCEGNALKYLARHPDKGGVTDLMKAAWYVHRLIEKADQEKLTEVVLCLLGDLYPGVNTAEIVAQMHRWKQGSQRPEA